MDCANHLCILHTQIDKQRSQSQSDHQFTQLRISASNPSSRFVASRQSNQNRIRVCVFRTAQIEDAVSSLLKNIHEYDRYESDLFGIGTNGFFTFDSRDLSENHIEFVHQDAFLPLVEVQDV